MAKKTIKNPNQMNVIKESEEIFLAQNLDQRNQDVEKAYQNIIKGSRELLTVFENVKYRTNISIDHSKSGKDTKLISEWISIFWNVTLTMNKFGYAMIYVSYDSDALSRFGEKIYHRFLRVVFKCTNYEATESNVENSIRIDHEATDLQPFFISRILSEPNEYVHVTAEDKVPS